MADSSPDILMETVTSLSETAERINKIRAEGKTIGFVPTMGALHQGHISLVNEAKNQNDYVVVSIFVNPTQFNNPEDLKNYPRSPVEDAAMLKECKIDLLFTPDAKEIYFFPNEAKKKVDLGDLENVMEGKFRPGHFDGVIDIVSRLFEIIKPDRAYFGEKDFQQLAVIRLMNEQIDSKVKIVACETVREENGLAMSSRNLRLSEIGFKHAALISKTLFAAKARWKNSTPEELISETIKLIEKDGELKIEYVEIADVKSLRHVNRWHDHEHVRCFAAVFCEGIRLIDNVALY